MLLLRTAIAVTMLQMSMKKFIASIKLCNLIIMRLRMRIHMRRKLAILKNPLVQRVTRRSAW